MAIEYQLKFEDGTDLATLAGALRVAGFSDTYRPETLVAPGLTATVGGTVDHSGRWRSLEFMPKTQIFFGQDKFADYFEVMDLLVDTVRTVLDRIPVDAAMTFDNEVVLLLRRNGETVLTSRDDWWTSTRHRPSLVERLGYDYTLEFLPII